MNLNRIRIGCSVTAVIGVMYSAVSLFDSLAQVALGAIIAAAAIIAHGGIDYVQTRRDAELQRGRAEVWARRDAAARWTTGGLHRTGAERDGEVA